MRPEAPEIDRARPAASDIARARRNCARLRSCESPSQAWRWIAVACTAFAAGCASSSGAASTGSGSQSDPAAPGRVALVAGDAVPVAATTTLALAGARCAADHCTCRRPGVPADAAESAPPPDGVKRFELRMAADGGAASTDISAAGTFATSGEKEICAYVDIPVGTTHDVVFASKEAVKGGGVAPRLAVAEYGPKGPYWYDIVAVSCDGPGGRCDRGAADDWKKVAGQRKRGRIDPCGSTVVTRLGWQTSGGQAERDGGLFRDFSVHFTMEVKKFATQFAPGSTECVPK